MPTGSSVTIVMPVYNSMPYLTRTLESLSSQTLPHSEFDIIAVDDGSTDGSSEVLDRFACEHENVTVIHQPNSGWPGMPRNRGLDLAHGRFVFFMDADDELAPNALALMLDAADAHAADVVVPRMAGTGGRGVQGFFATRSSGELPLRVALETLSPQKLFRREMLERHAIRFPEGRIRLEDGIFLSSAYTRAARIELCGDAPIYFIAKRDNGQNISSQPIEPEGYVRSVHAIAANLRAGVDDAARADLLVLELFQRKGLRFYSPKRWFTMPPSTKEKWVSLHHDFLRDEVPAGLERKLKRPADAQLIGLLRVGDLEPIERHVSARARSQHSSEALGVVGYRDAIELLVAVEPRSEPAAQDQRPAVAAPRRPRPFRLRFAEAVYSLARPFAGIRAVRAASRASERLIAGPPPLVTLQLGARRRGTRRMIPARWAGERDGRALYRFIVPAKLIESRREDVLDLWTVISDEEGNLSAGARLRAPAGIAEAELSGATAYATNAGNLSIRVGGGA